MATDNTVWIETRLERTETSIVAVEDAIDALVGGAQTYSLDTGQTRQSVTKANLTELRNLLQTLEERREGLRSQLGLGSNVGSVTRVVPGY